MGKPKLHKIPKDRRVVPSNQQLQKITKKEKRKNKKEQFLTKLEKAKELDEDKLIRCSGMGSLSELLSALKAAEEISPPKKSKPTKITSKMRRRTMKREVAQFSAVLDYPPFQNDPMGSILTHLTNKVKLEQNTKKTRKEKKKKL